MADEVRKLAEQTKQSVQSITATINNVQNEAVQVKETATLMSDHLNDKVIQTRDAIGILGDIVQNIESVGHSTGHIAALAQEQSADTDDISMRISQVLTNMEQVSSHVSSVGKNVYNVGAGINSLHKLSITQTSHLKTKHYLRIVKTDHLLWKWWLYNFILGYHHIDEKELVDHHQCRLGIWYDETLNNPSVSNLPSFKQLEAPHRHFHENVRRIYHFVKQGKLEEAEAAFDTLEEISQRILNVLDQLAKEVS